MRTTRITPSRALPVFVALFLVFAACGGDDEPSAADTTTTTATTAAPTTTTTAAPTTTATATPTTTSSSTTTTTTAPPIIPLEEYPVSNDWVVETVVAGVDSGTGGLAIDADGFFYQGDFGYTGHTGNTVWRIAPDGSTIEAYATSEDMNALTMTVFGPDGTLYQSSYNSDQLFKVSPDGTIELVAEGLRGPTGIVVRDDGTLFVEAFDSNTLHRILPDGTIEDFVFDRRFNGINGITSGPDGTLYLTSFKDGSIFSVAEDGTTEKLHQFPEEGSHLIYHDGSLFVTSRGGFVVWRYDLTSGDVEIIAGCGEPGEQDGRGGEACFGRPNAITLGPDGAFYINHGEDTRNDPVTIKRISFQPES